MSIKNRLSALLKPAHGEIRILGEAFTVQRVSAGKLLKVETAFTEGTGRDSLRVAADLVVASLVDCDLTADDLLEMVNPAQLQEIAAEVVRFNYSDDAVKEAGKD